MLRSEIPQHPLHGFSKVRKFLTRTPALACGASVTRKVRMNANFFFSRKFAPFAPFALRLHRKIKNSSMGFGKTMILSEQRSDMTLSMPLLGTYTSNFKPQLALKIRYTRGYGLSKNIPRSAHLIYRQQ